MSLLIVEVVVVLVVVPPVPVAAHAEVVKSAAPTLSQNSLEITLVAVTLVVIARQSVIPKTASVSTIVEAGAPGLTKMVVPGAIVVATIPHTPAASAQRVVLPPIQPLPRLFHQQMVQAPLSRQ